MNEVTANRLRNIGSCILMIATLAMLMACASSSSIQTVKTVIPVPCQETEPTRPIMPTDRLLPGSSLDAFVQATTAEIERREGYEITLVTALRACIAPIAP